LDANELKGEKTTREIGRREGSSTSCVAGKERSFPGSIQRGKKGGITHKSLYEMLRTLVERERGAKGEKGGRGRVAVLGRKRFG